MSATVEVAVPDVERISRDLPPDQLQDLRNFQLYLGAVIDRIKGKPLCSEPLLEAVQRSLDAIASELADPVLQKANEALKSIRCQKGEMKSERVISILSPLVA
ncbi:MAG: hypothetical protein M9953_04340 [Thermomicrobiales bacterium]|nr:hypothetical protein [Thermomicrobiales bacterium]